MPLTTNVATGDANHAALHNEERAAINGTVNTVIGAVTVRRRPNTIIGLVAGADNTSVLNSAFAAAQPYDTLTIPSGQWTHSNTLVVPATNPNVRIEGAGKMAELVATVPRYGGFRVLANGTSLVGLKHTVLGATARGNGENYDDSPFSVWNCSDIFLEDLTSVGSRDAAFFISTVQRLNARGMVGKDSFADGFHITNGTKDVVVESVDMVNPGDDGVAVVSYANESLCERVKVTHINVTNGLARGVSVVGGNSVDYYDINVHRTRGAGVYVGNESNGDFTTLNTTNVQIAGVRLDDANWDSGLDHGVVLLINQRSGTTINNVRINGLRATGQRKNTDGSAYACVKTTSGNGGRFTGVILQDWILNKGTGSGGLLYVDGLSSPAPVANGSFLYDTLSGSGVTQDSEGCIVYGATSQSGTAASTAAAPDFIVRRVATR